MPDPEVVIRISAKNLTEEEFKKVRKGIAGLGEESDNAGKKGTKLERTFRTAAQSTQNALRIVAKAAAVMGAAIGAAAGTVVILAKRGTELNAVAESFQNLSAAAGESANEMLAATRSASEGLVSDFAIMQAANRGLLLGLPITSDSMAGLARTAIVLGKAMGQDATKSLDDLITALGRSSPLILDNLGLTVKVGEANEQYARKLGKSSKELTDAEKKMAFYEAAVTAANAKVEELGGIQLTLGDRLQQTTTFFQNLVDKISVGIARSPMFSAAVEKINDVLLRAFGSDVQDEALAVVNMIERGALIAIEFGKAGLSAAGIFHRGFAGIRVLIVGIATGLSEAELMLVNFARSTLDLASKIPGFGDQFDAAAIVVGAYADQLAVANQQNREMLRDAAVAAAGNDAFGRTLETLRGVLDEVGTSMVATGMSQREMNSATGDGVVQTSALGGSMANLNLQMQGLTPVALDWTAVMKESRNEIKVFGDDVDGSMQRSIQAFALFGERMLGVGNLTSSETLRMMDAFNLFGITTRTEQEKVVKAMEEGFKLITKSGEASAKDIEEAERKLAEARQQLAGETTAAQLSSTEAYTQGSLQILGALGTKFKAAAIAGAIISTYQAIAKALASAPWPANLVLAAGAAAAGFANVAKIRSSQPGFETGTRNLDFEQFGASGTLAVLHRREAIIPEGSGHLLAREMASEMDRIQSSDSRLLEALGELRGSIGQLGNLPRAIQRAVRDGVLLAA